jgi:hypothetical protein
VYDRARKLLRRQGHNRDKSGRTVLLYIASRSKLHKKPQLLKWTLALLARGADADARDCQGWTALHHIVYNADSGPYLIRFPHLENVVRVLVRSGLDVNATDSGARGYSALHWAVMRGSIDMCRLIALLGGDPSLPSAVPVPWGLDYELSKVQIARDSLKGTPWAARAHPRGWPAYNTFTPLEVAAAHGHKGCARAMLSGAALGRLQRRQLVLVLCSRARRLRRGEPCEGAAALPARLWRVVWDRLGGAPWMSTRALGSSAAGQAQARAALDALVRERLDPLMAALRRPASPRRQLSSLVGDVRRMPRDDRRCVVA